MPRTIPCSVKCDKGALRIRWWKHRSGIEHHRHRSPVSGVRDDWTLCGRAPRGHLDPVAAVLGRVDKPLLVSSVVAVWPSEVVACFNFDKLFCWIRIFICGVTKDARPVHMKLVGAVLRGVEFSVRPKSECRDIS